MKHQWLKSESLKWVDEGIISDEQQKKIMSRYKGHNPYSLVFFFASILIGLAFLTFIAANWQAIHHLVRMTLIVTFLIIFYFVGNWMFERGKNVYGVSCFIIAIAIFGSGIFLSGQMYHYSFNNVLTFFMWGLAAFLIYMSRPNIFLLLTGLIIVTMGQIYGLLSLRVFDWWLFALFMIAFGSVVFIKKNVKVSWFFAIAYLIQMLAFTFEQLDHYYWLIIFIFMLYIVGMLLKDMAIATPFQAASIGMMFFVTIIQAIMFESEYARTSLDVNLYYYLFLAILFMIAIWTSVSKRSIRHIQLILFFPVFLFIEYASLLSYVILFVFSIGKLVEGYQTYENSRIYIGSVAFLISTFIVYFQVAWGFFDKSLFFLIGGMVLFVIGYLLEKHRRDYMHDKKAGV